MKKFYVFILCCLFVSGLSAQICELDGSDATITQADIVSCLTTCGCSTIEITGAITTGDDWDLSGYADLVIRITSGGSLAFDKIGPNTHNISLSGSASLDIEAGGNMTYGSNPNDARISFSGGASFAGDELASVVAAGGANANGLPVELSHFEAKSKDNMVELAWTTASELNNEFFQVEHSRDGLNFNSIGKVKGQGTTSETIEYDFMHRQPISGTNYYRLKQVDFDGAFEYSNVVVAVLGNRSGGVQIYPNPTINKATIMMNERPENIKFRLSNLLGQGINLQPNQVDAGWELDLSSLSNGIYILKMEYDGQLVTKRIVKE